jgi:putative transposase
VFPLIKLNKLATRGRDCYGIKHLFLHPGLPGKPERTTVFLKSLCRADDPAIRRANALLSQGIQYFSSGYFNLVRPSLTRPITGRMLHRTMKRKRHTEVRTADLCRKRRQARLGNAGTDARCAAAQPSLVAQFARERFRDGGRLRILAVVDDCTRECLALTPRSRACVARELERLPAERGKPRLIVVDSGTELTSNAILGWTDDRQDRLALHPKADAERLRRIVHGHLRGALLIEAPFRSLPHARALAQGDSEQPPECND